MDNLLKKRQNLDYQEKKRVNSKKIKMEEPDLFDQIIFDEEDDLKNKYTLFDEKRKKENKIDLKNKNIDELIKYGEEIGIKNKKSFFESDSDKSEKKEALINNKQNLINIFKEKNLFYPNLTFDQNFLLLLLQDYFVDKNGFLLNEISEKLALKNKKKFLSRYIQNWINKGIIDAVPFRDGKNFFKIIKINPRKIPKNIKELFSKKNIKNIKKKEEIEFKSKLIKLIDEIYFGEKNHHENKRDFCLEKDFLKYILNVIKQNINNILELQLKNQNLYKIFNVLLKNYEEINKINLEQYDFLSKKFLSFFLQKKYLIFNIKEGEKKTRKKLRTETRLNRIIYILKIIKEKNYLSFRDLSLSIENNLENEKNFKIDKKTLLRILNDIEECKLIKLKKFLVTFKQKNSYDPFDEFKQTKIFILDKDFEISDEKLQEEKYLENPFYRENSKKKEKPKKEDLYIFEDEFELKKEIDRNQRYFDFFELMKIIEEKIMFKKFKEVLVERYVYFLIEKEFEKIEKEFVFTNFEMIDKMIKDLNLENGLNFDNIKYTDFFLLKNYFKPEEFSFHKKYLTRLSFFTKKLFSLLKKNIYWNLEDLKDQINSERLLKISIDYLMQKKKIEIKIHNKEDFLIKLI